MARYKTHRGGLAPDKYLSDEEYTKLLSYVRQQGDIARQRGSRRAIVNQMIIEMLALTGLRAEELCHLQIKDVPSSHGKDVIYVADGKGHISRPIEIPHNFARSVTLFVKEYRKGAKPQSPMFVNERGYRRLYFSQRYRKQRKQGENTCRLSYDSLYHRVRLIGNKAGLNRLTPHVLRHSYLTRLYNIKSDLIFTRDQAGHKDMTTTAIYAKTEQAERRRQVEALYY